jgi:hypothetical protein
MADRFHVHHRPLLFQLLAKKAIIGSVDGCHKASRFLIPAAVNPPDITSGRGRGVPT